MVEAKVVETIEAPIDRVWERLGNFSGIKIGPGVESVEYEGDGVGMTRKMTLTIGTIIERLDEYDAARKRYSYSIINDDCPLPFADYSAILQLNETDKGATEVVWIGTFEARNAPEEKAAKLARTLYSNAIAGARAAVLAKQNGDSDAV